MAFWKTTPRITIDINIAKLLKNLSVAVAITVSVWLTVVCAQIMAASNKSPLPSQAIVCRASSFTRVVFVLNETHEPTPAVKTSKPSQKDFSVPASLVKKNNHKSLGDGNRKCHYTMPELRCLISALEEKTQTIFHSHRNNAVRCSDDEGNDI